MSAEKFMMMKTVLVSAACLASQNCTDALIAMGSMNLSEKQSNVAEFLKCAVLTAVVTIKASTSTLKPSRSLATARYAIRYLPLMIDSPLKTCTTCKQIV